MLDLFLLIVLILLLCGGTVGIRNGAVAPNAVGLVLVIVIIFVLIALLAPIYPHPYYRWF
jgi:hypothetical protein